MARAERGKKGICTERLRMGAREREHVQNKQRKVWIKRREGGAAGAKQKAEQYIFSLWREENYRLLVTMCLAGHKWRDLEIVGEHVQRLWGSE